MKEILLQLRDLPESYCNGEVSLFWGMIAPFLLCVILVIGVNALLQLL
jgi:hypothetical protein